MIIFVFDTGCAANCATCTTVDECETTGCATGYRYDAKITGGVYCQDGKSLFPWKNTKPIPKDNALVVICKIYYPLEVSSMKSCHLGVFKEGIFQTLHQIVQKKHTEKLV